MDSLVGFDKNLEIPVYILVGDTYGDNAGEMGHAHCMASN
jgi:hypothetical protein